MKTFLSVSLFIFFLNQAVAVNAAPKADLWELWTAHDPKSTLEIDHTLWDLFLKQYVSKSPSGINLVGYAAVSREDRQVLAQYIALLAASPVSKLNRAEQRALWINLYNALTVQVILEHFPVKTIRDIDISPGFFSDGPWGKKLVRVEGTGVSLDEIEHRILRPIWQDNRIHYAVNCASLGCPNLQIRAFTPANAEELLNKGARDYVNHRRGAALKGSRLQVSSIYKWFKDDFGGTEKNIIEHLRRYADGNLGQRLQEAREISSYSYDWSLNGIDSQ